VLLIGDAAGYVDALTGEGIAVGLATARAAVAAIAAGRPEAYPAAWRAVTRRYRWSATALLAVADRPGLRRRLVPAAAALPGLFGLAVDHVA
jgi:flavin-dependent dehydrogenase